MELSLMPRRSLLVALVSLVLSTAACGAEEDKAEAALFTFADVEVAASHAVDCMREEGFEAEAPTYNDDTYAFSFSWVSQEDRDEVAEDCIDRYYFAMGNAWADLQASEVAAQNRQVDELVVQCLRKTGIEIEELNPETAAEVDRRFPGQRYECLVGALDSIAQPQGNG
ncbi:MAG: hypothetical protein ABFR89_11520 [Actinomycetota bacterium]